MLRKRLGQILISGIFTTCAVLILALVDRVIQEKPAENAGLEEEKAE